MADKSKLITGTDFERINSIIEAGTLPAEQLNYVEEKLANFDIIASEDAPSDLVTMNSKVKFVVKEDGAANGSEEVRYLTVTYPRSANMDEGRISVMTPLGISLLGGRIGDEIDWKGNDGSVRKMVITEILYQPESSGDWNL